MGNVFQGFTLIGNRQQFMMTDVGPRRTCMRCDLKRECSGGCPALNYYYTDDVFACDDVQCKLTFVGERVDDYMRRRHDEVFGTNWRRRPSEPRCDLERVVPLPA